MMSGLLGSLVGFTGSVIPAITDHFAKKQEYKFEIEKMEKQAELMRAGYDQEMKMYQQRASDDEHGRLIEHDVAITKNRTFIGALQSSVRPVITYSFFILFAIVEISLLSQAIQMDLPLDQAIATLWDEDTKAIWGAVIAFWFGSRAIEKSRNRLK
jgi:hypothetical protein